MSEGGDNIDGITTEATTSAIQYISIAELSSALTNLSLVEGHQDTHMLWLQEA